MRILLPTGRATYRTVREAAKDLDAEVAVTGDLAAFLTPTQLTALIRKGNYDMVIVSGMCTASFAQVETDTGVPVYRGPRHAADLGIVLACLDRVALSRDVPADEWLAGLQRAEAERCLIKAEDVASFEYRIRGVKIGGGSRMKVIAEVMDAHRCPDLWPVVESLFVSGADIVDLGFGFDATPSDVRSAMQSLEGIKGPLAIDTQDPDLIRAGLERADVVASLHEGNIGVIGSEVADAGICAIVVPHGQTLEENIAMAEGAGVEVIIADPLLQPVGSGLLPALSQFRDYGYPLFFGAGNVTELLDADSVGANALLAGLAWEAHAAIVFTSDHSDKCRGSVREMRRATEMMALMEGRRPYPKDLGIDLLVVKEKRRRREPPLEYRCIREAEPVPGEFIYDPCGNFRIGIENERIVAVIDGKAFRGKSWAEVFAAIQNAGDVSLLDHAAYLGRELYKAELAIRFGRSFEQDGDF